MKAIRQIVFIWLAWSIIIVGYMTYASVRYKPERPDDALTWSQFETTIRSNDDNPYLLDTTLNALVAWDSEYYLAIATTGYEDTENIAPVEEDGEVHSKSYAFFPLYPYLMKVVRVPFVFLGFSEIGASTIAGMLISLLGTLAGMLAIFDLSRDELGEDGAVRSAFMMLIFPVSFFFAVIYTEGLFVGLAFGSLAMLRRKQWLTATFLAVLATWTRSVGAALLLPLLLAWAFEFFKVEGKRGIPSLSEAKERRLLLILPALFAPILAYLIWRMAFGVHFDFVQDHWFGNKLFDIDTTMEAWRQFLEHAESSPEARFHMILGLSAVVLGIFSCLWNARK
jgi:Gpi18-like mannosyltransferase